MGVFETEKHYNGRISDDHAMLLDWLSRAENSKSETEWRREAQEDYKFYSGDQDTREVKDALKKLNRPNSTFNEIKPKIDILTGFAGKSKFSVQVVPVTSEDAPLAELMTNVVHFYRRKLKMYDLETECFEHTVKSGRSLLYFYISGENPFQPEIKMKRIPGEEYYKDPKSQNYDLSDARFIFINKWINERELKTRFGNPDTSLLQQHADEYWSNLNFYNEIENTYRVVECWYKKYIEVYWFQHPVTQAPMYLEPREFSKFEQSLKGEGIRLDDGSTYRLPEDESLEKYPAVQEKMFYMVFSGEHLFDKGPTPYVFNDFPCVEFGAYKDDYLNRWFGIIKSLKDPQRTLNTMRRQYVHLLKTLPKGFLVHEAGSVLNIEDYEQRSADPSFHLEVQAGKIDKIRFEQQPQISPVFRDVDGTMSMSMKDLSGIQNELLGIQTTSREPGVSVRARMEQSLAVLYPLFYNFQRSRTNAAKILMKLLQQFVPQNTVIRITGQQGMQLMEINSQMNPAVEGFNDISAAEFDLEVDESVETPTARLAVAQLLSDMNHNNPGMIPPSIILEYANLPFSVISEVQEFFRQQQEAAMKAQEREFELQEKELQIKAQATSSDNKNKKEKE